jgi:hypothetical protein
MRNGIVAESPQDLHGQIRGLAAESPVFLPVFGQKIAPKMGVGKISFRAVPVFLWTLGA